MKTIAMLDADGVLQGTRRVSDKHKPGTGQMEVPEEFDLTPGAYRWDGAAFMPCARVKTPLGVLDRNAELALAGMVVAVRQAGIHLPPETLDWLAAWQDSFDAMGV